MKKFSLCVLVCSLLVSGLYVCASSAHAQTPVFTRTLYIGSQGPDVAALQKYLNVLPATGYFGSQTASAVREFQRKHASTILQPYGFTRPTGIVSTATISLLNTLIKPEVVTTTTAQQGSMSTNSTPNPNLRNIDRIMASIDRVMAKKNATPAQISEAKTTMLQALNTPVDLRKEFYQQARPTILGKNDDKSLSGLIVKARDALLAFVLPQQALAISGSPFGGYELGFFPCTCTAGTVWGIILEPLPPTYPVFLAYTIGTQLYASYTLPYSPALLGFYVPTPGANSCLMVVGYSCPSNPIIEGQISPEVGSAL